MTVVDATAPFPAAEDQSWGARIVRFLGNPQAYWSLLIRGAVLLMVTLGIYRFWLATDIRRFLWANTEIAGNSLEYTGTARELLLGFLIALAILIPFYVIFSIAALGLGVVGPLSTIAAFIVLAFLGHFAVFRARRYRLTRTIYRGVRFHQGGSSWRYALCALLWWTAVGLTIGLAYPFAQASLERFKMKYTYYGNLRGRFDGSGLNLFLRGVIMWLLVVGPLIAAVVVAIMTVDPVAFEAAGRAGARDAINRLEITNPGFYVAVVIAIGALFWGAAAAMLLYPAFQALTIRWWASGLRFGEVAVHSQLRTRQIYGGYLRFLLYALLFTVVVGFLAWIGNEGFEVATPAIGKSQLTEFIGVGLALFGYVVFMLGLSTIYQATVKLAIWQSSMESLDLTGFASLDWVRAAGEPSSAIGEGLADALDVGGL